MTPAATDLKILSYLETLAKFLTPLVIFAVGTLYTCNQDKINNEQKALDRCISLTKDLTSTSDAQQQVAIAMLVDQCQQYHAIQSVVVPRLLQTAQESNSTAVVESAKKAAITISANSNVATQVATAIENLPARLFFHIPDESRRGEAASAARHLKLDINPAHQPYSVEGIESVGPNRSPSTTQVRYFRIEDAAEAQNIASQLVALGVRDAKATQTSGKAIPFQIEVWFGKSTPPSTAGTGSPSP
jgi:hypothetical protein